MSRLALSSADKQARDWFVKTTKNLGCDVKVDTMGELPFSFPIAVFHMPTLPHGSDVQPPRMKFSKVLVMTSDKQR